MDQRVEHWDTLKAHADTTLPRCSPFVGFLPHAPRRWERTGQLGRLFQRRRHPHLLPDPDGSSGGEGEVGHNMVEEINPEVPPDLRKLPYVGYQRHAPPSPLLRFKASPLPSSSGGIGNLPPLTDVFELAPQGIGTRPPGGLPMEIWLSILHTVIEVPSLLCLAAIGRCFPDLLQTCDVWRDRDVRLNPGMLEALAPQLNTWLRAWRHASRLIVPKSQQLITEISRQAPHLKVDVAWRFNAELRGAGVEIVNSGLAVRRMGTDELVVLGDAPLPTSSPDGSPYLEVCLDVRGDDIGDGANDFGVGLTACNPDHLDELGAAAVEVPQSWVVDFTRTSLTLSFNDIAVARGAGCLSSGHLKQGDRIGLRVTEDGCVEVFLNGVARELLAPPVDSRVPTGTQLFAVLDLWGRSVQISRTQSEAPAV